MSEWWWGIFLITGIVGGGLAGLLGIGGGIVYVTVLAWWIDAMQWPLSGDDPPKLIIANSIAVIFFTTAYGTFTLMRKQQFDPRRWVPAAAGGILGIILSTRFVLDSGIYHKKLFSMVFLGVVGAYFLFSVLDRSSKTATPRRSRPLPGWVAFSIGLAGGLLSGLLGIGGGMVMVPLLLAWMGSHSTQEASHLSLITIPWMTLAGMIMYASSTRAVPHLIAGQWKFFIAPVIGAMSIGTMMGVPLGLRLGTRCSVRRFKAVFLLIIVASAVKMLFV